MYVLDLLFLIYTADDFIARSYWVAFLPNHLLC
jgi:hypothetical protein